jgi:hypothetical protein
MMAAIASGGSHRFGSEDVILLVVVAFLVIVTGFLAMSETAITRTTKVKAVTLVEEKRRGAQTLLRLVEHIDRVLPVCCSCWSCAPSWPPPWSALSPPTHSEGWAW